MFRLRSAVCALRPRSTRAAAPAAVRGNATLARVCHDQDMGNIALIAPRQDIQWTYGELSNYVGRLAGGLAAMGCKRGTVIATDLPSCAENLLLQLAASHLGAAVLTLKGPEDFAKLAPSMPVCGAVAAEKSSFLWDSGVEGLKLCVEEAPGTILMREVYEKKQGRPTPADDGQAPLGYYSAAKPVTNAQALEVGAAAREKFGMKVGDRVLVSITLNHLFGIGSAVSAALQSGATIVLPDASGVVGCGNPVQRARATGEYLGSEKCTLFYADTHTFKALTVGSESQPSLSTLRGGVVKVGSGSDFLGKTMEYAGATLFTMGKK